jgi:chloramphenicol 3-O phosphotransferase
MMRATGRVILLNGTPSSGKTTLANALHDAFPTPSFFIGLDEFRLAVPARFWVGDGVRTLFDPMVEAWLRCLREVATRGIHVIAEAAIIPKTQTLYDDAFGDLDVLLVGVRCPLGVVHQREAQRMDRINGPHEVTADDVDLVHRHDYDLEVDTSVEPTAESVSRILRAWHTIDSEPRETKGPKLSSN